MSKLQTVLLFAGEAARLAELCISPSEFDTHLSIYGHYCPVSLNLRGELADCSDSSFLQYSVEFRSKYYKTSCKEDMETFLGGWPAATSHSPIPWDG